jgi:hypothetical protein
LGIARFTEKFAGPTGLQQRVSTQGFWYYTLSPTKSAKISFTANSLMQVRTGDPFQRTRDLTISKSPGDAAALERWQSKAK